MPRMMWADPATRHSGSLRHGPARLLRPVRVVRLLRAHPRRRCRIRTPNGTAPADIMYRSGFAIADPPGLLLRSGWPARPKLLHAKRGHPPKWKLVRVSCPVHLDVDFLPVTVVCGGESPRASLLEGINIEVPQGIE